MSTPHLYIRNYHLYLNNVNIPLYIIIAYYFDYLLMNDVQKPPFLQYLRIPKRVQVPFSASIIFIKKPKTSLFSVFFFSTILKKTLCLRELFVISLETFD